MARQGTTLDDAVVVDGDMGFLGFRSRVDPLTLPTGFAQRAENMRFVRGRAEVRKGIKRLADEINPGNSPLTLPFALAPDLVPDEDPVELPFDLAADLTVTSLTRSVSTVTATVVAHGLATGRLVNIRDAVQPEYNGDFTITVTSVDTFTYVIVGFPATPATGTIIANAGPVIANGYPAMTRVGSTVTVTITAHGYENGRYVNIRGAEQEEYNGDFVIAVLDANTFTFEILSGDPASPASGAIYINGGPVVRESYGGGIFAGGVFSSPASSVTQNGREWIVLVGDSQAYLWRDGEPVQTLPFPAGQTVESADSVLVLQAFNLLFILRSREITGEWARQEIVSLVRVGDTVTITFPVAHGLTTNDRVCIEGADQAGYNWEFDVDTTPTATTLTFTVDHAPVTPATGTITGRKVQAPMLWDGESVAFVAAGGGSSVLGATYGTLRSTSLATYFNNQLVIAPTPAQDAVLVSDVLDYDAFDEAFKSFRANAGSSDHIVALHPFAAGDIMVFMRNSIYRAHIVVSSDGTGFDAAESFIELITNEVGCRARDSVVTAGPFLYFLADQGVYRMDTNYSDYKTRGVQVPLSDAISDLLEDINEAAVATSCAAWFDNRYWLAIPTNGSELPNTIVVWNALNNEWESKDTYPTGIHKMVVSDYQNKRRLFGISLSGTLFLLEEREDGDDLNERLSTTQDVIAGKLITRRLFMGNVGPKKWKRVLANFELPAGAGISCTTRVFDFDGEFLLAEQANTTEAAEDYSAKWGMRAKAHSLEMEFNNTQLGRFTLRSAAAEAMVRESETTRTNS